MAVLARLLVMIPTLWCSERSAPAAASTVGNRARQFDESFFPVFHIRPPRGHVNDVSSDPAQLPTLRPGPLQAAAKLCVHL
eukprot:COSAG02_NODE_2894_length_7791_cov_5.387415_3_plen_81_part_00